MSNPIIDAISWDTENPGVSALALQTQLALLQVDWTSKLARQIQIRSTNQLTLADWLNKALETGSAVENEADLHTGFNPATEEITDSLRLVREQILSRQARASIGHSERRYLSQTSVIQPSASVNTTYLFQETVYLPRDAYIIGCHPLVLKSSGANPCSNVFRPQVDGAALFSGNASGGAATNPRPGFILWPTIMTTETYVMLNWASPEPIAAGLHTIEMDIYQGTFFSGSVSAAAVAPFFNLYTSTIEAGTMPTTYVQPSVSFLEFIYV